LVDCQLNGAETGPAVGAETPATAEAGAAAVTAAAAAIPAAAATTAATAATARRSVWRDFRAAELTPISRARR